MEAINNALNIAIIGGIGFAAYYIWSCSQSDGGLIGCLGKDIEDAILGPKNEKELNDGIDVVSDDLTCFFLGVNCPQTPDQIDKDCKKQYGKHYEYDEKKKKCVFNQTQAYEQETFDLFYYSLINRGRKPNVQYISEWVHSADEYELPLYWSPEVRVYGVGLPYGSNFYPLFMNDQVDGFLHLRNLNQPVQFIELNKATWQAAKNVNGARNPRIGAALFPITIVKKRGVAT